MPTERTPLTSQSSIPELRPTSEPAYIFPQQVRRRQRQVKQLQFCVCAAFVTVFSIAVVIMVSYSVMDDIPFNNSSDSAINITVPSEISVTNETGDASVLDMFILLTWPLSDESLQDWNGPNLTKADQLFAVAAGERALGDREIFEESMPSPAVNSPSFKHQRAVATTREARIMAKRGFVEDHATRNIMKNFNIDKENMKKNMPQDKEITSRWTIGKGPEINFNQPENTVKCDFNLRYRTANGTCNNINFPYRYGVAMTPFRRALYPDYADGVSSPRQAGNGEELPTARQISIDIHRPSYATDPNFTVMLAVWGQFLDHDITATAGNQGEGGKPIECCDTLEPLHPECFPVLLSKGDPYFDQYNVTCMNFVRSAPAPTGRFGPREQLNQATSFIDGSVVYGNSDERVKSLRTGQNGTLRMFITPDNRTLLPLSEDPNDGCNEIEMNKKGHYCFESGDARANENLHLTSMHLIWARHHNYLAANLQLINPSWDDETLFQEARKILAAQMQHITYNEFLPIVLGKNLTAELNLFPFFDEIDKIKDFYNPDIDPNIANHFAAAAFRFAHTLIPGLMKATRNVNDTNGIELHKMLFNPYSLYGKNGVDDALGGAMGTPLARSDPYFTNELSEKLFQNPAPRPGHQCGLDLVSLNIQRGRDHGLPSYNEWRKKCHLPPVDSWLQLADAIDSSSFSDIQRLYNSSDDIDVYTGGLSEPPIDGAIIGPLFTCLVTDQFLRIKFGDSHWYERQVGPQKFTKNQLNQIYKTTLASVICINSDDVTESPKSVMRVITESNPSVKCTELTKFDFTAWRGEDNNSKLVRVSTGNDASTVMVMPNGTPQNGTFHPLE